MKEITRADLNHYERYLRQATKEQARRIWKEVREKFGDEGYEALSDWLISIQEEDMYERIYGPRDNV